MTTFTEGFINRGNRLDILSFASMADFTAAGGASACGRGPVWVGGTQYWCDGVTVASFGETVIGTFFDS